MAAHFPAERRQAALDNVSDTAITERTLVAPEQIERAWDRVRRAGHAINDEETIVGAVFLAAPFFDAADTVCGSISIGLAKSRYRSYLRGTLEEGLKECCRRISSDLKTAAYVHENVFAEARLSRKAAK